MNIFKFYNFFMDKILAKYTPKRTNFKNVLRGTCP